MSKRPDLAPMRASGCVPSCSRGTAVAFAIAALLVTMAGAVAQAALGEGPEPVAAIKNAWIFDSTGHEPYLGTVRIHEGRIEAAGPKVRPPSHGRVIDAKGKALLPGLFDLHTHWTPASEPDATPGIATAYLAGGVTTVNDFNEAPESFEPRRRWLATLAAPHVNFAARFSTPLGHGADWADEQTTRWVNTPQAARRAIKEVLPYHPDVIKAFTDGWRYGSSPDNSSMDETTLAALVDEAHANGLKVLTHTVTVDRALVAARAKVDVIAHSIQDREFTAEDIALIKASGTSYAPTLAVYEPRDGGRRRGTAGAGEQDPLAAAAQRQQRVTKFGYALHNVKALHDVGVNVAVGTDAGMFPHAGATDHELELLVSAGLTPTDALLAGTINSARAIGLGSDRGTIEPGRRADLVLVDGKPWQDITSIRKVSDVLIDGRLEYSNGKTFPGGSGEAPAAVKIASLIDSFERTDGRSNLDTLRTDEADGGLDRSIQVTTLARRENGEGHSLLVTAELSSKPEPFASVIIPLTRGSVAPADLRPYHGLRLDVRGSAGNHWVALGTVPGAGPWRAPVDVTDTWQKVEVPFERFAQQASRSGAPATAWTGLDVVSVSIAGGGKPGEHIWFEVDNVELY